MTLSNFIGVGDRREGETRDEDSVLNMCDSDDDIEISREIRKGSILWEGHLSS